jgi:putative OPT family oligopeptide transporter
LLLAAYGFGAPTPEHPHSLPAPQANLMASVVRGVFGGGLPWGLVAIGAAIGAVNIAFDVWLERRGSGWRAPSLAVAVGIYLPLEVSTPLVVGGVLAALAARRRRRAGAPAERDGVLFAAGLITGEAMLGILLAIPIVIAGDAEVLALPFHGPATLGLAALAALCFGLYRAATAAPRQSQ